MDEGFECLTLMQTGKSQMFPIVMVEEPPAVTEAGLNEAVACAGSPLADSATVCADPENSGRVVVFERWAGEDNLIEHFKTPHIATFREAIKPYPRSGRSLHRYFVERREEFQSLSGAATS